MPVTITVVSWNIESLGDGKATLPQTTQGAAPQQSEIVPFVALAIRELNADIVGIMEIKSGRGELLRDWLVAALNGQAKGPPWRWRGVVSSRQDGGTTEEYLYLWKEEAERLVWAESEVLGPTLLGVLDDNALQPLFDQAKWDEAQCEALYAALEVSGYIYHGRFKNRSRMIDTRTWRVRADRWQKLAAAMPNATVAFSDDANPPPMDAAANKLLARIIVGVDILRFITFGDRSPFLGHFLVGPSASPARLMVSLLHAPGPQDPTRTDAINVMGMSDALVAGLYQGNLLVMGDFNIFDEPRAPTARVYTRDCVAGGFGPLVPTETEAVFASLTEDPLNLEQLLKDRSTLLNTYLANDVDLGRTTGMPYDRFFFGSGLGVTTLSSSAAQVANLVGLTAEGKPGYVDPLGRKLMEFFRAFRGVRFFTKQRAGLERRLKVARAELNKTQRVLDAAEAAYANATADGGRLHPKDPLNTRLRNAQTAFGVAENTVDDLRAQIDNLDATRAMVDDAATDAPTGYGSAAPILRYAVSDHLPICVRLTV